MSENDKEQQRWIFELQQEHARREHDRSDDFHKYVNEAAIRTADAALRNLMLVNGGAAVALLTFIGALSKEQKPVIANTLAWFASGVALAVAGMALAYFTNFFMAGIGSSMTKKWERPFLVDGPKTHLYRKLNLGFHIAAVVVAILSLIAFVVGIVKVRNGLANLI
jgi:hypothetical protein